MMMVCADADNDVMMVGCGLLPVLYALIALLDPGVANFEYVGGKMMYICKDEKPRIDQEDNMHDQDRSSSQNGIDFCSICGIFKHKYTVHCPVSNICIKGYVEYSQVIDKPIGKFNRIPYVILKIVFMLSITVNGTLIVYNILQIVV